MREREGEIQGRYWFVGADFFFLTRLLTFEDLRQRAWRCAAGRWPYTALAHTRNRRGGSAVNLADSVRRFSRVDARHMPSLQTDTAAATLVHAGPMSANS